MSLDYNGFSERVSCIVDNVERAVSGKREGVFTAVVAMLAGGHVLIEDVPGVGKTLLAKSLARSIRADFRRIQFTPDLLPADVTGLNVYNQGDGGFEFWAGPVFANVVLADEINRASPKTQSALLEAMEEGSVTVDGVTRQLPQPFGAVGTHRPAEAAGTHARAGAGRRRRAREGASGPVDGVPRQLPQPFGVVATQNPVEHEGTYPLPHAELDRFMVKMRIGYPDEDAETEMLRLSRDPVADLSPVVEAEEFMEMRRIVEEVYASEAVLRYVVSVTSATREHRGIERGAARGAR